MDDDLGDLDDMMGDDYAGYDDSKGDPNVKPKSAPPPRLHKAAETSLTITSVPSPVSPRSVNVVATKQQRPPRAR